MEIISTDALISINATFFSQLVSFLLFVLVLNKVMVRPLRKVISKRDSYIYNIQKRINQSKEKIESFSLELARKKKETIEDSLEIASKMKKEANIKAISIYEKTKKEIIILQKESDTRIVQQIDELRSSLLKDVDDFTILIMEKIIGRRLGK